MRGLRDATVARRATMVRAAGRAEALSADVQARLPAMAQWPLVLQPDEGRCGVIDLALEPQLGMELGAPDAGLQRAALLRCAAHLRPLAPGSGGSAANKSTGHSHWVNSTWACRCWLLRRLALSALPTPLPSSRLAQRELTPSPMPTSGHKPAARSWAVCRSLPGYALAGASSSRQSEASIGRAEEQCFVATGSWRRPAHQLGGLPSSRGAGPHGRRCRPGPGTEKRPVRP